MSKVMFFQVVASSVNINGANYVTLVDKGQSIANQIGLVLYNNPLAVGSIVMSPNAEIEKSELGELLRGDFYPTTTDVLVSAIMNGQITPMERKISNDLRVERATRQATAATIINNKRQTVMTTNQLKQLGFTKFNAEGLVFDAIDNNYHTVSDMLAKYNTATPEVKAKLAV